MPAVTRWDRGEVEDRRGEASEPTVVGVGVELEGGLGGDGGGRATEEFITVRRHADQGTDAGGYLRKRKRRTPAVGEQFGTFGFACKVIEAECQWILRKHCWRLERERGHGCDDEQYFEEQRDDVLPHRRRNEI